MRKYYIAFIFIFALVFSGCSFSEPKNNDSESIDPKKSIKQGMIEEEAKVIAEESCIKGGGSLAPGYYNENTKTWWFDANLNSTKEGCNPACVVFEEARNAEINWRCTGLIMPEASNPEDESEDAKTALISFFDYLSRNEFQDALNFFEPSESGDIDSWEGIKNFSLPEEQGDKAKVLENYCEAVGTCLGAEIVDVKKENDEVYNLVVQFKNADGSAFVLGPCCGATEEEMIPQEEFNFIVKKINDSFKVITAPVYRP